MSTILGKNSVFVDNLSTVLLSQTSLKFSIGTLLQVYPITDKGNILVLCFLPNDVCPVVLKDDEYHITSSTSSLANLVVSCDDGTFCLLQCSVAFTPPPKPLVDK